METELVLDSSRFFFVTVVFKFIWVKKKKKRKKRVNENVAFVAQYVFEK